MKRRVELRHPKFFEKLIISIFPSMRIGNLDWLKIWNAKELERFTFGARAISIAWFLVYASHYWLIDIPAKKDHLDLWAMQRAIVSTANFLSFIITFSSWYRKSKFYKLPLFIATAVTIHQQSYAMLWRADVPFFYVPLQALLGVCFLRLGVASSLMVLPLILAPGHLAYVVRPGQNHHMISATIVVVVLICVLRTSMVTEIRAFLAEKESERVNKDLIEVQKTLNDQLRGFLPSEIYRRVQNAILNHALTPVQAVDEVLRPRNRLAAILFSDIRGFTKLTNSSDDEIISVVSRAQQLATETVEHYSGIPRLHGDLIYSYFDNPDSAVNIVSALRSGIEILDQTKQLNVRGSFDAKIIRYVIISFGSVTVGNIGSSAGARDISVLGAAANLPSRIDRLTKCENMKQYLAEFPVVMSGEAFQLVGCLFPNLAAIEVKLSSLNIVLDEFPEEKAIYLIPTSVHNCKIINESPDYQRGSIYIKEKYKNSAAARMENAA